MVNDFFLCKRQYGFFNLEFLCRRFGSPSELCPHIVAKIGLKAFQVFPKFFENDLLRSEIFASVYYTGNKPNSVPNSIFTSSLAKLLAKSFYKSILSTYIYILVFVHYISNFSH